jgi:putative ABC transport system permease protein
MVKARYRGAAGAKQGRAWSADEETDQQMKNREQNLSYRPALAKGESLVEGKWMDPEGAELEASLEQWFAARLGVKLGDSLSFDVQGVRLEAKLTSLRKVHWASFQPNFFILLSPWALKDAPKVFIGSVSGADGEARGRLQSGIVDKFPNVTVFDVAEGGKKLLGIMDKIAWAIRVVALFSLAAGLVVLAGIALSTARARRNEAALLKTLGAGRGTVLASLGAEFGALGLVSGLLGLGLSTLFGWVLLEKVLEIPYRPPWAGLLGLGLGLVALCALTGMLSGLGALRAKPLAVLREE